MVFPTWSIRAAENPGAPLSGGILLACGANRPTRLACRLGRFAAERHWRSLTPSRAHTIKVYIPSLAREGGSII